MDGTLLYGAIRKEALVDQTICSALSVYQAMGDHAPRIVLVTDMAERFARLFDEIGHPYLKTIRLESISRETAEQWMAGHGYPFRLKIKLIEYYMGIYQQDLLFLDADTYLRGDISSYFDRLRSKEVFLYQGIRSMESFTENIPESYPGFERMGPKEVIKRTKRGGYLFRANMTHYNSGVIGMPFEYARFLPDILELSDQLYERTGTVSSEEYAFSTVFQSELPAERIHTACDEVAHYVYFKDCLWLLYHALPFERKELDCGLRTFLGRYKIDEEELHRLNLRYEEVSDAAALFHMCDEGVKLTVDNYYLFALRNLYTVGDRGRFYQLYFRLMDSPVGRKLCQSLTERAQDKTMERLPAHASDWPVFRNKPKPWKPFGSGKG